jgi:hypothetical protein
MHDPIRNITNLLWPLLTERSISFEYFTDFDQANHVTIDAINRVSGISLTYINFVCVHDDLVDKISFWFLNYTNCIKV